MESKNSLDEAIRFLRFIYLSCILSAVLCIAAGELVQLPGSPDMQIMVAVFGFVGLADLGFGFFLRKSILEPARETLRRDPQNPEGLASWKRGNILAFVFAQTTIFFGLLVRLVVGRLDLAIPFYVIGGAALILWAPRHPDA